MFVTSIVLVFVTCMFGCNTVLEEFDLSENFDFNNYNIGERFSDNRDEYLIKLNNSFFARITYKNDDVEIYKLLDTSTTDYFGNCELYYTDNFEECFCNNNKIIVYTLAKDECVQIDCNDKNNIKKLSKTDVDNIDLGKFTQVVFY